MISIYTKKTKENWNQAFCLLLFLFVPCLSGVRQLFIDFCVTTGSNPTIEFNCFHHPNP